MDYYVASIVFLCLFLLLAFSSMHLAVAFTLTGFFGLVTIRGFDGALSVLGSMPYGWGSSYALTVLPLFVLMGEITYHSGMGKDIFDTAYKWVGSRSGGLALATNLACTGFAACTGSSLAAAATMGSIAAPEMKRFRYNSGLATGTVAAGGTLGILIPPSTIFIIYGFMTETSIGKLFIAGIIPGIILSFMFLLLIVIMCHINPLLGPRGPSFSWAERFKSLKGVAGVVVLFFLVIGSIYFGIVTPVEAASVGAFGALVITLVSRKMNLKLFTKALKTSVRTTCMIFLILIGTQVFNTFMATTGAPGMLTNAIKSLNISPFLILTIFILTYIPLGMVMDSFPMTVLTIPFYFPVIVGLGFNPVWFGVLLVVMCELANITPPVGLNLFIVMRVSGVPLGDLLRGATPFMIVMLACEAALMALPQISLFLPNTMK